MKKLNDLSLCQAVDLLYRGETTSEELTRACLEEIEKTKELNAIISVDEEFALMQAKEADIRIKKGEKLPLLGVPIVVKDNICTNGYKTTCASKFLANFVAPYEATVVKKLKNAGAVILAKANMDEFAMGASGENSAFGPTLNPVDKTRVAGGSSSGSAASVSAHQCFASLGTDTGGSIRQPAGFCGVVGMKPTYGRVSRYGVVAFASSLDQVGPITKTVKDNAKMLEVISGKDNLDATTQDVKVDNFEKYVDESIKGKKIGVAKEYFELELDPEIKSQIEKTIEFYRENGAEIVNISLPNINKALAVYYILSSAEAASNLSRFDGIKYGTRADGYDGLVDLYYKSRTKGFGAEVKRRILIGNYTLSAGFYDAYYKKASQVREVLKREFKEAFKKCDAIISPVSPSTAFKFGAKKTPLENYLSDIYTVPVNIVGVPAISFPVGVDSKGLPVACQLIANYFDEKTLYSLAGAYERIHGGVR